MKFKTTYLNLVLVIILCMLFGSFFFFTPKVAFASIKDDNIVYNSVEKVISINENKVCDITETITVTYQNAGINVGLTRNISKVNTITRIIDGKEYSKTYINDLELHSVTMDGEEEYNFLEEDSEYFYINTGEDNDFKVGQHIYEIKYTYDMGEDFISGFDDFTFDIMDYGFQSEVEKFSATIILPKSFYDSKDELSEILTFRTNNKESIGGELLNLEILDNSISVSYENLSKEMGFTMQLILPNGYFDTTYMPNALYFVVIAILILSIIGIIIILCLHKFHRKTIITPEFYPPKNLSTIDVASVYRGKLRAKDFSALIIEWASKKLISIEILDKRNIILTKLKDFPTIPKSKGQFFISKVNEKNLFNAFFAYGDTFVVGNQIVDRNINVAIRNLYKRPEEVSKKVSILRYVTCFLAVLPILLFIIWRIVLINEYFYLLFILLFPVIGTLVFTYFSMPIVFKIVWCTFFGGFPLVILIGAGYFLPYDICYLSIITAIIMIAGIYLSKHIKLYTKEELKLRGKILGLKNFIALAEVERLEMLIEEDPEYYYKILPYCYIFNLTDKFESKFKALNLEMPDYCQGFSATELGVFITSGIMSHYSGSTSTSSSIGRRSGGGFGGSSGGGGGGGGCSGR